MSEQTVPTSKAGTSWGRVFIFALLALGVLWYAGIFKSKPRLAIVTAGDTPYWDAVVAGAQKAAETYDVNLEVIRHKTDLDSQTASIRDLMTRKVDGIAVSAINPSLQAALLTEAASATTLVTMDSDAPGSGRLCFVGTDNYNAGRTFAEQIKLAIPDGGEVILCVGNLDKDNAHRRRQGVIDELLDRPFNPDHPTDAVEGELKGDKYNVVMTIQDNFDAEAIPKLLADAMNAHPNVKCLGGLNGYTTPGLLKGLDQLQKSGQVKVVAFDANDETLSGIESGNVFSTILQDQFGYGFHAVRILAESAKGEKTGLPMFQRRTLPVEVITKDRVPALRAQLSGKPLPTTNPS